jgi:hypothetical protein
LHDSYVWRTSDGGEASFKRERASITLTRTTLMDWTRYNAARPTREGWHLVHYSRAADGPGTYWTFWNYRALYWHPMLGAWTEDARTPAEGGAMAYVPIELWAEIAVIEGETV